jgi:hypothetical protein
MDAPGVGSPLTSASEAKLEDAEEALALAKAEAPMALLALQLLEVMVSIVLYLYVFVGYVKICEDIQNK